MNSVKTIKQLGIEDFKNYKTENRFIQLLKTIYSSGINSIFSSEGSAFVNLLFTIIMLWTGSHFVLDWEITTGALFSFYAIIGYFTSPVSSLIDANKTIQNAVIASDRLFEIMDLEKENNENKIDFSKHLNGDIRFEQIYFSYETRTKVFENFSLQISQGKVTAIIGESGSVKTTLTALLQKLYVLNTGKIYIGGTQS